MACGCPVITSNVSSLPEVAGEAALLVDPYDVNEIAAAIRRMSEDTALGERYTHGHVVDFYRQLREHPDELNVLGDGHQRKSYLYVHDCIDAILLAMRIPMKVGTFNLGTDEYCEVNDSIGWICEHLGLSPKRTYSGGTRGWVGDSPFIFLGCSKIRAMGWKPTLTIREGVIRTVEYLKQNPWILEKRA